MYELGKLWIEKENLDKLEILLDTSKLNKRTKSVLIVEFILEDSSYIFSRVFEKEYDSEDIGKYLYKSGSSRGTDISPSCIITDPNKTFENKFFKWFNDNKDKDELILNLFNSIAENKEQVFNEVKEKFESLEDKTNALLSFAVKERGDLKYVGDFDIFREILLEKSSENYYMKGNKKIKGIAPCFLCNDEKEVYGLVASSIGFAFSTPEKIGNVQEHSIMNQWKQLPICGDCALYLEAGKKFVEKYLSFSEFGLRYYVIPNFLFDFEKGFDSIYKYVRHNKDEYRYQKYILSNEDKFVGLIDKLNDVLEFKFLYYESSNSAFNILAYVESVLPSWLHELYDAQLKVVNLDIFSEKLMKTVLSKESEGNLIEVINSSNTRFNISIFNWYLSFLRDFYPQKFYLDTVTSILAHEKISYDFLLTNMMNGIRKFWRQGSEYLVRLSVLKALSLIVLFSYLDLFKGEKNMKLKLDESKEFFENYPLILEDTLDAPDKRASFLLGALTRKLTYIQFKELNSSPFYNKLWGLSLDKNKIQKLYPMVLNKLREYDRAYLSLEDNIAKNLVAAENCWKLTRDETSYYFALGFTLAFAINNEENEEEGVDNE